MAKFVKGDKAVYTRTGEIVEILSDRIIGEWSEFPVYRIELKKGISTGFINVSAEGLEHLNDECKPCPFCGERVKIENDPGTYGYYPPSIFIKCKKCGIYFSEVTSKWEQGKGHFSVAEEAKVKLLTRWNTRF